MFNSQRAAVAGGEADVAEMETRWRAFTDASLKEINAMLTEHQLKLLKPE